MVRILGTTGSRRRRRYQLAAIFSSAVLLAAFAALPAQAVHDTGIFQLDGDATTTLHTVGSAPFASDDWDKVCAQYAPSGTTCGTSASTSGSTSGAWTAEPNRSASIFTGGGSKDPQDIPGNWAWKDAGGLPDKDNLEHAFAVRYSATPTLPTATSPCPNGTGGTGQPTFDPTIKCELLYFGSDRFDNSGDAQNGVWFFQKKVGLGSNAVGGGSGFTGQHTLNDVLVVSDFSNGGTNSIISVYTWDPACTATNKPFGYCADANLHLQETSTNANCATAGPGDGFCGLVNPSTILMPWPFTDKSGTLPTNSALNGEFYEGGINLSTLGLGGTCFSSVLSETRSSTSTTATLKDFILSQLAPCAPSLTTQASNTGTVQPGTAVHDTATITVTGGTNAPDPTGTVNFFLCTDPSANPPCTSGGTSIGSGTIVADSTPTDGISSVDSPNVNTSGSPLTNGFYCFRATWAGDSTYGTFNPPLTNLDNTNECFRVLQLSTSIVTDPQSPAGTNNTGPFALKDSASVYDHAVVTGDAAGGFPEGTVTFFICDPSQVDATGGAGTEFCAATAGTQVGTPVTATHVTGETIKTEATSAAVTANLLGVWCFRATYTSTSAVYTGSSGDGHRECFTVTTASSATTVQKWLPNDHVVVSTDAGTLTGTLDISLRSGTCSGPLVYQEPAPYDGSDNTVSAPVTVDTTNTGTFVNAANNATPYFWRTVFVPNSSFATGFTKCETTVITITN